MKYAIAAIVIIFAFYTLQKSDKEAMEACENTHSHSECFYEITP